MDRATAIMFTTLSEESYFAPPLRIKLSVHVRASGFILRFTSGSRSPFIQETLALSRNGLFGRANSQMREASL